MTWVYLDHCHTPVLCFISKKLVELRKGATMESTLCFTFGLHLSLEAETTTVNFFPMPLAKKLPRARHGRPVQSKVNLNDFLALGDIRIGHMHDDMQPECPFAVTEISSRNRTAVALSTGSRNRDMMQAYSIFFLVLPAIRTDSIEGQSELSECLLQGYGLLGGGIQLYSHGSIHRTSVPCMLSFCKQQKERRGGFHSTPSRE